MIISLTIYIMDLTSIVYLLYRMINTKPEKSKLTELLITN